jgi:FPC/CPF motif-containing protein YcgG
VLYASEEGIGVNANAAVSDWTRRIIVGTSVGADPPPDWLADAYRTFHANLSDHGYPCYFGSQAEQNGALYYSFVSGAQIDHLPLTLHTFLSVCLNVSQDKNNLVVFFEPDAKSATSAAHRDAFWATLRYLRAHDPIVSAPSYRTDPSDPLWEFPFAGSLFFIVGISPTFQLHRSRNLGPCLMMVFQPREVFQDGGKAYEISVEARDVIRARAQLWDGVPSHPDLNIYGRPANREWTQYFISDDNAPEQGQCPLLRPTPAGESAVPGDRTRPYPGETG